MPILGLYTCAAGAPVSAPAPNTDLHVSNELYYKYLPAIGGEPTSSASAVTGGMVALRPLYGQNSTCH